MVIPSQVRFTQAERCRDCMAGIRGDADKETVQTTNPKGATKVVAVRITDWSLVQVQVPPPKTVEFLVGVAFQEQCPGHDPADHQINTEDECGFAGRQMALWHVAVADDLIERTEGQIH